jgi:hypothetical protein
LLGAIDFVRLAIAVGSLPATYATIRGGLGPSGETVDVAHQREHVWKAHEIIYAAAPATKWGPAGDSD